MRACDYFRAILKPSGLTVVMRCTHLMFEAQMMALAGFQAVCLGFVTPTTFGLHKKVMFVGLCLRREMYDRQTWW